MFLLKNLLVLTLTKFSAPIVFGELEYYDLDLEVESRPLPPELQYNKTQRELEYEECMSEYILCFSHSARTEVICAGSRSTIYRSTFMGICEMSYENCKSKEADWMYEHDGECVKEMLPVPVLAPPRPGRKIFK